MENKKGNKLLITLVVILTGLLLILCVTCLAGPKIKAYFEHKNAIKTAESLLNRGEIKEAEAKFIELGEYEHVKGRIQKKKEEKSRELIKKAEAACEEKRFEEAVRYYKEAKGLKELDFKTEADFNEINVEYIKEALPARVTAAETSIKSGNYYQAKEESKKVLAFCDEIEAISVKEARDIKVEKWREKARVLIKHAEKEEARAERDAGTRKMRSYESTTGNVGVAVYDCNLKRAVSYYYVEGDSRFVCVGVSVINEGSSTEHVNPNDFTLSTPGGYTVSHDVATYSLGNYFDAVNLPSGGSTSGWLIFIAPKNDSYVLNYENFGNTAKKTVYLTE